MITLGGVLQPRRRQVILLLVLVAASLRLWLLHTNLMENGDHFARDPQETLAEFRRGDRPFMFVGMELSNIACALVCDGQGFASPFGGATGPTGWGAPGLVLPYIAGFKLFGCFTIGSFFFAWGVMLVASLVTLLLTERAATAGFEDPRVGLVAASLFVLSPFDVWAFRVVDVMDLNLPALAFAGVMLATINFVKTCSTRASVVLGVTGGLATLVNPGFALCTLLPVCLCIQSGIRFPVRAATVAGILALVVAPYLVAQRIWLGQFVFVKSNAPFEIYLGNTPANSGLLKPAAFATLHPSRSAEVFRQYRDMGETAFVAERFGEFRNRVGLREFATYTARRCLHYFWAVDVKTWDKSVWHIAAKKVLWAWVGGVLLVFAVWRRLRLSRPEVAVFAVTLAYAAPFMITGIMERYRVVITPASIVLQAGLVVAAIDWVRRNRLSES